MLVSHNTVPRSQLRRARSRQLPLLDLGSFDNGGYLVRPLHSDQGVHTAARRQLVHAISGLLVISLPHNKEQEPVYLIGGPSGMLLASDGYNEVITI